MTIPFKLPAPARLPRDLQVTPARHAPTLLHENADDPEDDATLLWKPRPRSGLRHRGAFATSSAKSFAFKAQCGEDDSTLIKKPNLADPRLLRSDRPPALVVQAFEPPPEPACVPPALLAFLPPPRKEMADEALSAPAVMASPSLAAPSDWEEIPYVPELTKPSRLASREALWGAAVLLAALAAVVTVVLNPEQSAVLVERVVASGTALVAFAR